jgi:uncharacterized membrane protein
MLRVLLSLLMVTAGTLHFVNPATFMAIVPSYLPSPLALVYISGFFEILGGVGLQVARFRRWAAWGLVALFIAVFPANVNMALHQLPFGQTVYPMGNWFRLPLQLVLIYWAYCYTKPAESTRAKPI